MMRAHPVLPALCTRALFPALFPALLAAALFAGCRGSVSERPPIHLNPNMDNQQKYLPQHESRFFADGKTMQAPPEHTVAQGELREDDAYFRGRGADSAYVDSPVPVTPALLARGAERYRIFCQPCHGDLGNGRGVIMQYKFPIPPTSYFDPRILAMKDGNIYDVISNGIRNMPSYRQQIPVPDRWAIVAHVRTLQRAALPDSLKYNPVSPSTTSTTK
jgi:mono/diheme cytochrome c family protein